MPGLADGAQNPKKRKQSAREQVRTGTKRRAISKTEDAETERIRKLEEQIAESRKYYNNIVTLLSMLNDQSPNLMVAVSLCRIFCRLLVGGQLQKPKGASEQDLILVAWLRERYREYQVELLDLLHDPSASVQVSSHCVVILQNSD